MPRNDDQPILFRGKRLQRLPPAQARPRSQQADCQQKMCQMPSGAWGKISRVSVPPAMQIDPEHISGAEYFFKGSLSLKWVSLGNNTDRRKAEGSKFAEGTTENDVSNRQRGGKGISRKPPWEQPRAAKLLQEAKATNEQIQQEVNTMTEIDTH